MHFWSESTTLIVIASLPWALAAIVTALCIASFGQQKADGPARAGANVLASLFFGLALFQFAIIYFSVIHRYDLLLTIKVAFGVVALGVACMQVYILPMVPDLRAARRLTERNKELELDNVNLKGKLSDAGETVKMRGAMVASIVHELAQPLKALMGMHEQLLDSKLTDKQMPIAKASQQSAQALMALVFDIQEVTRLEMGKTEMKLSAFPIRDVLTDAISFCTEQARTKRLFINTDVDPAIDGRILGDRWAIGQVLVHLLRNAVHRTARGGIVIRVTAEKQSATQMSVCFAVRDAGYGLSEEEQKALVESLETANFTRAKSLSEASLDLYISKLLVQMMHGTFNVQSKRAEGTTISFTLNVCAADSKVSSSGGNKLKVSESEKTQAAPASPGGSSAMPNPAPL